MYIYLIIRGLIVCITDHYPLGNQRNEISRGLNISEKLGRDSRCLNPRLSDIASSHAPLC